MKEPASSILSSSDDNRRTHHILKPTRPKRKAPHKHPGSKKVLPERVSDWKLSHTEKHLHIFYQKDYLATPYDVLQKLQILQELDGNQRQYFKNLQQFLEFDSNLDEFCHQPDVIQEKLDRLSSKLAGQTQFDSRNQVFASSLKAERFIIALHRFHEKIQKQRQKRLKLYEGMFTQLVVALGEICNLEAEWCSTGDESIWENLRGCKHVISRPDCRFYKQRQHMNLDSAVKTNTVISVTEVKNAKKYEGLEYPVERDWKKMKTSACSKFSSKESSEESDCSSSSSDVSSIYKEPLSVQLPEILCDLNSQVLGQHAGELLLDLHEYHCDRDLSVLTSPGLIVDGTKVYFTLLEMTKDHHQKLCTNRELNGTDRATIYYSRPLDILRQENRNNLIELFVKLNNIY